MTDQATAVSLIRAMQPDPTQRPANYLEMCNCTFSELARWLGFERARYWAEHFARNEDLLSVAGRPIRITYTAFLEAESVLNALPPG